MHVCTRVRVGQTGASCFLLVVVVRGSGSYALLLGCLDVFLWRFYAVLARQSP